MLSQPIPLTTTVAPSSFSGQHPLANAAPEARLGEVPAWQSAALEAFSKEARNNGAILRADLAARVEALTGCHILAAAVMVDSSDRKATTTVDGIVFQLQGRDLVVLRPCSYCGVGHFASPPISDRADLGCALSGWQPYHADCEPADPSDCEW